MDRSSAACTCGAPKGRAHTKDCALHEHTRAEFARALSEEARFA